MLHAFCTFISEMSASQLISFLIFFVGLEFALRISRTIAEDFPNPRTVLTKIGTFIAVCEIFSVKLLPNTIAAAVTTQLLLIIFLLGWKVRTILQEWLTERRSCLELLTQIIIKIRAGDSFRAAVMKLASENSRWSHWQHAVHFQPQQEVEARTPEERILRDEFEQIQREPHQALSRLVALREQMSKESDFRRRSGQVLLQIRMQAVVLFVLQIALTVFVSTKWGLKQQLPLIIVASLLHVLGVLILLNLGRRIKWSL